MRIGKLERRSGPDAIVKARELYLERYDECIKNRPPWWRWGRRRRWRENLHVIGGIASGLGFAVNFLEGEE